MNAGMERAAVRLSDADLDGVQGGASEGWQLVDGHYMYGTRVQTGAIGTPSYSSHIDLGSYRKAGDGTAIRMNASGQEYPSGRWRR